MCKACGTQCWVCPGKEFVPFQAPSATYEADGVTYNLLIVEGKPTSIHGTRAQADRNLVDGTILGRAPPKTDTAEEITMADVVPLNRRVDIRQEILSMEADDEALKVRERQVPAGGRGSAASSSTTPRWTGRFGRARTSNSSSRRRSSWPWSAGPTHSRVSGTTSTRVQVNRGLWISGWGTSCRCGRRRSPSLRGWESPSRAVRRNGATSLRRWGRFWQPRTSSSIAHCR